MGKPLHLKVHREEIRPYCGTRYESLKKSVLMLLATNFIDSVLEELRGLKGKANPKKLYFVSHVDELLELEAWRKRVIK